MGFTSRPVKCQLRLTLNYVYFKTSVLDILRGVTNAEAPQLDVQALA